MITFGFVVALVVGSFITIFAAGLVVEDFADFGGASGVSATGVVLTVVSFFVPFRT